DDPAGLAPGQLGDVRVLLLRHDRRPGGELVGEPDPAELTGRPEADLLADPGQVYAEQGGDEQELGDEVPVGDRVDRVGGGRAEAELLRGQLRVERERGTGERAGAERAHRGPAVPVPQPVEV